MKFYIMILSYINCYVIKFIDKFDIFIILVNVILMKSFYGFIFGLGIIKV